MFSGIIQTIGHVAHAESDGTDLQLAIEAPSLGFDDVRIGDSIAVSGVCLTVVNQTGSLLFADVSAETLACTTLGSLVIGNSVNLEKALRLVDRVSGHLVSGHVDAVGKVLSIDEEGRSQRWSFEAPGDIVRYIAAKGAICIDGVSLTVNSIEGNHFGVNLIPHTTAVTTFGMRNAGDAVNLEVDLVARYIERLYPRDQM